VGAPSTQFLSEFIEEEKISVVYQENHSFESRTRDDIVEYFIEREGQ